MELLLPISEDVKEYLASDLAEVSIQCTVFKST